MCEAIGHPVMRLVRTRIGPLADRKLKPGAWRELTTDEVRALERAAGPRPRPSPSRRTAPVGGQRLAAAPTRAPSIDRP